MNVQCKLHLNCALRHISVMSALHGGKVPLQVELRSLTEGEVAHSRHSCTRSFSVFWPRVDWSERKLKIDEAEGGGACFVFALAPIYARGLQPIYACGKALCTETVATQAKEEEAEEDEEEKENCTLGNRCQSNV